MASGGSSGTVGRRGPAARRGLHALLASALAGLLLAAAPQRDAQAIELTCIEASKYKYLYRIFNNDRRAFARFFGIDMRQLPHPEACRAVLLTGPIDPAKRDRSTATDFEQLLDLVDRNRAGLATVYLGSSGGNVAMGFRLGFLTRMFWLKTHAVDGVEFEYLPDFLGAEGPGTAVKEVPPELESGWKSYLEATARLRRVQITPDAKRRRCASACTYLHAAGIHRVGVSYFHRARRGTRPATGAGKPQPGGKPPDEPSLTQIIEGLHKTEQRVIAFYRQMDAGDGAIRAFQATATQTIAPAAMAPMPRYIDDYLRGVCRISARPPRPAAPPPAAQPQPQAQPQPPTQPQAQPPGIVLPQSGQKRPQETAPPSVPGPAEPSLTELGLQIRPPPGARPAPPPAPPTPPAGSSAPSRPPHHCIAAAHERERLRQFAKLCQGGCDQQALLRETTLRMRALLPEDSGRR
jgi:hypothetical protein